FGTQGSQSLGVADAANASVAGAGSLTVDPASAPLLEAGDTLAAAQDTGLGPQSASYVATGSLSDGAAGDADVDLYSFVASAGATLTAATALPAGGVSADTVLRLFDAAGNEVAA